jgi:hypothetical protein
VKLVFWEFQLPKRHLLCVLKKSHSRHYQSFKKFPSIEEFHFCQSEFFKQSSIWSYIVVSSPALSVDLMSRCTSFSSGGKISWDENLEMTVKNSCNCHIKMPVVRNSCFVYCTHHLSERKKYVLDSWSNQQNFIQNNHHKNRKFSTAQY